MIIKNKGVEKREKKEKGFSSQGTRSSCVRDNFCLHNVYYINFKSQSVK